MAKVPALGLGVYQLGEGLSGAADKSDYLFLREGSRLTVSMDHFNAALPHDVAAPLSIQNPHLQLWISSDTGLMEVACRVVVCLLLCLSTCSMREQVVVFHNPPPRKKGVSGVCVGVTGK